jgi:sec-independent protein translocase protein TatA
MGATEIIFIFVIYLLLFGAKGIPSLAQTMGQAVRTFRNATEDIQREILSDDARKTNRPDLSNVRERQSSTGAPMGDGLIPPDGNPSEDPMDSAHNSTSA